MHDRAAAQAARGFGETLSGAIDRLAKKGFTGNIGVSGPGRVECRSCHKEMDAEEVAMEEMLRIEGTSDPADEQLVAGVVCPNCNTKAVLVLSYGGNASPEDGEVARRMRDVRQSA